MAAAVSVRFRPILSILREEILQVYGERLVSLAVFGSVARGVATPESGLDFLIVADHLPRGRMSRSREFMSKERGILERHPELSRIELSPIFKTPAEVELGSPLFWDMTEDIIILHDRNGFFEAFLGKVKEKLARLKAYKVIKGDPWYWVFKGDYTPGEVFEI
jgi:hypothetical protein